MKTIIILFLSFLINTVAQEFTVEKISGKVKVLKGSSENWETLKINNKLSGDDLVLTEKKSFVKLVNNNEIFIVKDDVAVGLNHLKKVSTNDLILALALDEIRNVPKVKRNSISKNTAVYGTEIKDNNSESFKKYDLGVKKINGAKMLNESGYKESSIIVAKEVFRNYPEIAKNFEDRLYFADLLKDLDLFQEALSEYSRIEKLELKKEQRKTLLERNEEVSLKLIDQK